MLATSEFRRAGATKKNYAGARNTLGLAHLVPHIRRAKNIEPFSRLPLHLVRLR